MRRLIPLLPMQPDEAAPVAVRTQVVEVSPSRADGIPEGEPIGRMKVLLAFREIIRDRIVVPAEFKRIGQLLAAVRTVPDDAERTRVNPAPFFEFGGGQS